MKLALIRAFDMDKEERDTQVPLGLGHIKSYLEKFNEDNSFECFITDDVNHLIKEQPDIVGIGSLSTSFNAAMSMAKKIKTQLNIPVFTGGYHITALPHTLPNCFDLGIIGEGEETTLEVMKFFCQAGLGESQLEKINGIVYHKGKRKIINKERPLIPNLDSLPYPFRILKKGHEDTAMFTSRGCPYRCVFCASTTHWKRFRQFSAEYVIKEIRYLVDNYEIKSALFYDDLFIVDKHRFRKIAAAIIDSGINEQITFHGFVRSNLVDDETCKLLKEMGFSSVRFGAETGSDRLLAYLKSNTVQIKHHQKTIDLCYKYDLVVGGSFVFGTPGETMHDIELTRQFLKKNEGKFKIMGFYILTPIPGCPLWDYAKNRGLVSEKMNWDKLNQDPRREMFDWDRMIYLNDKMPKSKFKEVILNFMEEFGVEKKAFSDEKSIYF